MRVLYSQSMRQLAAIVVIGITAFSAIPVSNGQEIFAGWCPTVPPLFPFLVKNYSGIWYEVEKFWFVPEAQSSCVKVSYVDNGDLTFTVNINQQVNGGQAQWNNPGITRYKSTDGSASFILDLIVSQSPIPFVISYPYIVVDTDYTNYTIKYNCKQLGIYNLQTMWILTREKTLSPELKQIIHKKLESLGLATSRLQTSDLSTCPDDDAKPRGASANALTRRNGLASLFSKPGPGGGNRDRYNNENSRNAINLPNILNFLNTRRLF